MKDRAVKIGGVRTSDDGRATVRRLDRFVTRLMLLGLCGGLLPACSLAVPMGGVTTDDLSTGTIKRTHPSPFSAEMDAGRLAPCEIRARYRA